MVSLELEIPPKSAYVGVVRLALSSLARVAGLDENSIDDLKIAVSEACANAVISTEQVGSAEPVRISLLEDEDRLVIEIRDRGAGRSRGADGAEPENLELDDRADLSMALIRSLMSDCQVDVTDDGFNLTRLILTR